MNASDIISSLAHGAFLDGAKKIIGISLYFASKAVEARHPELQAPLEQIGQFFMAWGLASDAVKGAAPAVQP